MLKVTRPPKKLLARNIFLLIKKHYFFKYIALQVEDASLAIIYFAVGDLLSCLQSVFCMADNVAAESFENHNYALCRRRRRSSTASRSAGDAAACVSSYS